MYFRKSVNTRCVCWLHTGQCIMAVQYWMLEELYMDVLYCKSYCSIALKIALGCVVHLSLRSFHYNHLVYCEWINPGIKFMITLFYALAGRSTGCILECVSTQNMLHNFCLTRSTQLFNQYGKCEKL